MTPPSFSPSAVVSPLGKTLFTSPTASARAAGTGSAVKNISFVTAAPTSSTSRRVPVAE